MARSKKLDDLVSEMQKEAKRNYGYWLNATLDDHQPERGVAEGFSRAIFMINERYGTRYEHSTEEIYSARGKKPVIQKRDDEYK